MLFILILYYLFNIVIIILQYIILYFNLSDLSCSRYLHLNNYSYATL